VRQSDRRRKIRSFVIREGRITSGQLAALEELWPIYGVTIDRSSLSLNQIFKRNAPVYLEIGSGDGENLLEMAKIGHDANYLGCEVHRPGLGHTLLKLKASGLTNVRLVELDVIELLSIIKPNSLDAVCVFFPDPWPKKRHHKRRLVQAPFLDLLATRLKHSGSLYFATDDMSYAEFVLDIVERSPNWANLAGQRCYAPRPHFRSITRFEKRAEDNRRRVYNLVISTVPH